MGETGVRSFVLSARLAAENSVTLCGVRMGINGAEDQIVTEQVLFVVTPGTPIIVVVKAQK